MDSFWIGINQLWYFILTRYYSGEKVAPVLTVFIGGNHEASNYLQELPYGGWVAPKIYYMGKTDCRSSIQKCGKYNIVKSLFNAPGGVTFFKRGRLIKISPSGNDSLFFLFKWCKNPLKSCLSFDSQIFFINVMIFNGYKWPTW